MSMNLSSLKSLKKPGSPNAKLKPHQKIIRKVQRVSHTILNGSSKALSKAVIFLAAIEVRALSMGLRVAVPKCRRAQRRLKPRVLREPWERLLARGSRAPAPVLFARGRFLLLLLGAPHAFFSSRSR